MAIKKRSIAIISAAAALAAAAGALVLLWKPEPKGIVVGASSLPDSLNPVLEQNSAGLNADELVFDGLVNFEVDQASGAISSELALAEGIEQDPRDKRTYTVKLRQASWHDGNPVTAADVEFSFNAYMSPDNRSPKREYLSSFIEKVEAKDASTVEIAFRRPIPPFRVYPVLSFKIIPSRYKGKALSENMRAGENERLFSVEPVGSGPYALKSWEIGKWLSFSANASYFKKRPEASSLVIRKMVDPVIRMNELRKGRVNVVLETSPLDRPVAEKIPGIDINWYEPYAFYQVAINTRSTLFSDVEARVALSAALDKSSLVPSVTDRKEGVVINYGPFPADLFQRNLPEYGIAPLADPTPLDVSLAKRLAASSGLDGKTAILLYPDSLGEFGARMAEGIASQLGRIGLKVEAKRTGDQVFKRLVFSEKDYELALVYCDGFDNLFSDLREWYRTDGVDNIFGIGDSRLDDLLDDWDKTVVASDWVAVTRKIHDRISGLAPAVYLCTLEKDVYSKGVKDVAIASDNPFLSAEDWSLAGS
jgi:peptide/nickel transport system substrate-binding protein